MPAVPSPYFDSPDIGQIAQNMFLAVRGDPEAQMKGQYYGSEIQKNQADARKLGAEADIAGGRFKAQQLLTPDMLATLAPQPGESATAHVVRTAPLLSAMSQYGISADDIAKAQNTTLQNIYSQGQTQGDALTAMKLHGTATNEDYVGVPSQAPVVFQAKSDQAAREANIKGGYDIAGKKIDAGASITREAMHGVTAGADVYMAPSDPRYWTTPDHVLHGAPTEQTTKGQFGERLLQGDQRPENWRGYDPTGYASLNKPGAGGKPPTMRQPDQDKMEIGALSLVPGVIQHVGSKTILPQEFIDSLPPERRAAGLAAMNENFFRTRDPAQAGQAYLEAAGLTKSSFTSPYFFNQFGGLKDNQPPATAPAAQPAAGQQPAHVTSEADYNALAPNTQYYAPDGSIRTKGANKAAPATMPAQPAAQQQPVASEASYGSPKLWGGSLDAIPPQSAAAPQTAQVFAPPFKSEAEAKQAVNGPRDAEARTYLGMSPAVKGPEPLPNFSKMSPSEIVRFRDNPGTSQEAKRAAVAYLAHAPVSVAAPQAPPIPTQITSQKMADMVLSNPKLYANMVEDAKKFNANRYGGQ